MSAQACVIKQLGDYVSMPLLPCVPKCLELGSARDGAQWEQHLGGHSAACDAGHAARAWRPLPTCP